MQQMLNQKDPDRRVGFHAERFRRWYWAPVAVSFLGMISLVMLLWIYSLNADMRMNIHISNALTESQIKIASSHLWLEQAIAGDDTVDLETVQAELKQASSLIAAIMEGGQTEYGLAVQRIEDHVMREKTEIIQAKLAEFIRMADQRIRDPRGTETASSLDRQFDALFMSIQARLEDLKASIEGRHLRDQINWRYRFMIILIAWLSAILIALTGLWLQEARRKAAVTALQQAMEALNAKTQALKKHEEHLQELVDQRTTELTTANQTLQQENSERKKAEESLQASESRFRSLVEHLPLSIALKDKNSVYRYCNHACARDLEVEPQEVFGKTDHDFFPPELAERHIAEDARILNSGRAEETTERYFRHGQEIVVQKIKLPITGDAGDNGAGGLLSIVQDITEKTRLESIAEAANTMKNIGYVFAGVRHELGNPVSSLKMTLRLLQGKIDICPDETVREYVDRAMAETEKMEYLLRTLKNFNMYETPVLQDVPMQTFLERFLSMSSGDFQQKGILIRSRIQPEAMSVTADPRALQQILLNVMSNAADALGGREKPEIVIDVSKTDGIVRIQVTDNGRGMSEQQRKDLFKPFHTTKPGGTGLGLVITQRMLIGMNGAIAVQSREGKGTTVDITLPGGGKK